MIPTTPSALPSPSPSPSVSVSMANNSGTASNGDGVPGMHFMPDTRPISQEQLMAKVKGIFAGLVMVEAKCIEVDNAQTSQPGARLKNEQWQALIALHRTLLHEHHDFFPAPLHPSDSVDSRRLPSPPRRGREAHFWSDDPSCFCLPDASASRHVMPAGMWRHGIHSFLELLRHRLPVSLDHMLTFIYLAYSMMALLYEPSLPAAAGLGDGDVAQAGVEPARMWRHGIHSFLEALPRRLSASLDHMLNFIYLAYSMMALLYEPVSAFLELCNEGLSFTRTHRPAVKVEKWRTLCSLRRPREDTWIECLGDLGRYRMAIVDDNMRDREDCTTVCKPIAWRQRIAEPTPGRLDHHSGPHDVVEHTFSDISVHRERCNASQVLGLHQRRAKISSTSWLSFVFAKLPRSGILALALAHLPSSCAAASVVPSSTSDSAPSSFSDIGHICFVHLLLVGSALWFYGLGNAYDARNLFLASMLAAGIFAGLAEFFDLQPSNRVLYCVAWEAISTVGYLAVLPHVHPRQRWHGLLVMAITAGIVLAATVFLAGPEAEKTIAVFFSSLCVALPLACIISTVVMGFMGHREQPGRGQLGPAHQFARTVAPGQAVDRPGPPIPPKRACSQPSAVGR